MSAGAALVSGSSRGIGRAIALGLAEKGFAVAINAERPGDELQRTLDDIRALGVAATAVVGDIGDIDGHEKLLAEAETALGPLTTLVNNAGVGVMQRGDLLEVSPASFDRCMGINTRGPFFLSQTFARRLLQRQRDPERHYCLINVSSANAVAAAETRGEYAISKAGLSMMSTVFAVRLGRENINVYELQPGLIDTDMTAPVIDHYRQRAAEGLTLTPRVGQPTDVAEVAVAMACGSLAYCTGQAIRVDGGMLIPRF